MFQHIHMEGIDGLLSLLHTAGFGIAIQHRSLQKRGFHATRLNLDNPMQWQTPIHPSPHETSGEPAESRSFMGLEPGSSNVRKLRHFSSCTTKAGLTDATP